MIQGLGPDLPISPSGNLAHIILGILRDIGTPRRFYVQGCLGLIGFRVSYRIAAHSPLVSSVSLHRSVWVFIMADVHIKTLKTAGTTLFK